MIFFVAGNTPDREREEKQLIACGLKTHLLSFFHLRTEKGVMDIMAVDKENKVQLFLDSGAYSAWTQGVEINIDEYIDFALEHIAHLECVANLDVIPGSPGQKKLSASTLEESAKKGWDNWQHMIDRGIPPEKLIHVFHQGEDFKWLRRMIKNPLMFYIGVSPANDRTTKEKQQWLDVAFRDYVCDKDGMPQIKTHGFGVTAHSLMFRYPWYSVDSTSWVITGRLGQLYVPRWINGAWNYREDPWKVSVSTRSPGIEDKGKHISNYSPMERAVILRYFSEHGYVLGESEFKTESADYELQENERWYGKEKEGKREVEVRIEDGLSTNYKLRDELNIKYFLELEKTFPPWPCRVNIDKKRGFTK